MPGRRGGKAGSTNPHSDAKRERGRREREREGEERAREGEERARERDREEREEKGERRERAASLASSLSLSLYSEATSLKVMICFGTLHISAANNTVSAYTP